MFHFEHIDKLNTLETQLLWFIVMMRHDDNPQQSSHLTRQRLVAAPT